MGVRELSATLPISSEPGSRMRPSSVMTTESGLSSNEAVVAAPPEAELPDDTDFAMPMASDEPKASTMTMRSLKLDSAVLDSWENITPDEMITRRQEMSQRSGSPRRAARIGLAKASPTMKMLFTPFDSITSSISSTENLMPWSVTIAPPSESVLSALNRPVPCMSGQAGRLMGPGLVVRSRTAAEKPSASRSGTTGSGRPLDLSLTPKRSSSRHITPFGMPVVPPVYSSTNWSPLRPHGPWTRPAFGVATAVSYGVAHDGQAEGSSPTQSQVVIDGTRLRMRSTVSVKASSNTTATASALSQMYTSSSSA